MLTDIPLATVLLIGFIAGSIVGGVVYAFLSSRRPAEKALALKALTKAIEEVGRLNSAPTPEQAAALAADAAKEAALIDAAKEAVGRL